MNFCVELIDGLEKKTATVVVRNLTKGVTNNCLNCGTYAYSDAWPLAERLAETFECQIIDSRSSSG